MFEDFQFFFEKEQPSDLSKSKLEQYKINNNQAVNKQNDNDNTDEIEEGPTLALFLLGSNYKKMTDLNFATREKVVTQIDRQTIPEQDDESQIDETQRLCEQKQEEDQKKINDQNEEIYFQTEAINYENELQELPQKIKSNSTIRTPMVVDSPMIIKPKEDKKQIIDELKESNEKMKSFDNSLKGGIQNSQYNTTKSTLGVKSPTNDSYFRNDSEINENVKNLVGKTKFSSTDEQLNPNQFLRIY